MKKLLIALALLSSFTIQASTVKATINEVVCGEMDPFVIGDACILFSTDNETGNKIGLVYSDYDWAYEHASDLNNYDVLNGRSFKADNCETFKNYDAIRELKDYNSDYFYLSCNIFGFSFN